MTILDGLRSWAIRTAPPAYDAVNEDEQFVGKESDAESSRLQALEDSHRRLKRWTAALGVLLAFAVLALLVATANTNSGISGGDSKLSPIPHIPSNQVIFNEDDRFSGPSTPERDRAWSSMMPDGDGFILLANSSLEQYSLPLGKSTDRGQVYDISLFHQLHCLANIRIHLFTLLAAMDRNNTQEIYDLLLKPKEAHVFHCFDYIRQALMCAGDMTIEWPRTEPDGRRFAVDGWGITHECKSWDAIMEFMEEKTVSNIW